MTTYEEFVSAAGRLLNQCGAPPTRCFAATNWFLDPSVGAYLEPALGGNPAGVNAHGRVWYQRDDLPKYAIAVA